MSTCRKPQISVDLTTLCIGKQKTDSAAGRSEGPLTAGPLCIAQPAQPIAAPLSDSRVQLLDIVKLKVKIESIMIEMRLLAIINRTQIKMLKQLLSVC